MNAMYADYVDPFYLIRLARGEELIRSLAEWAGCTGFPGGGISGLGAMRDVTLGWYDESLRDYRKSDHPGPVEILSLSGGISLLKEKPYIHIHAVIGDSGGRVWGGHLFRGTVTATAEIYVLPSRQVLRRSPDGIEPFHLLDLPRFSTEDHA
jgi:uncharacterized protein